MTIGVSVVLPARNAARTLPAQLAALMQSRVSDCELIVVDNGSTDGTASVVANRPGVRLEHCAVPGASAARNCGVRASSGTKILFCDADDVVTPPWIRSLSAALDRYDIVGGPLDWTTLNDSFVQTTRENRFAHELPLAFGVRIPAGANFGVRRVVFDTLGGFDETFHHGFDETDFCYRAGERGFSVGFAADAVVSYRLRAETRAAARQEANYTMGLAHFRAKHAIRQPWKSKVLRATQHALNVARLWRCRTRAGRFDYARDLASAHGAVRGLLRYGIVA